MTAQAKKLRAAIIGAGGRARSSHYVCVTRLSEQVELVAMAELDPVLMADVAAEFGIPRTYDDHKEMLDKEKERGLDVVYCIMNERYVLQPALDCIATGCAVMLEKPPGANIEETRQILAAAETAGVTVAVGVQRRFTNVVQEAMRLVGERGTPTVVSGTFNKMLLGGTGTDAAGAYGAPKNATSRLSPLTDDRRVPSVTTTLWNDGIHIVDTVRYMAGGEPVSIDHGVSKVGGQSNNVYTCRIEFDNGATGLLQANRAAGGRVLRAELHGAGVSCFLKLNHELEVLKDGEASVHHAWEIDTSTHPQPSPSPATGEADTKPFDGELAMHAHFLDCVRKGERPINDLRDVIKTIELMVKLEADDVKQGDPNGYGPSQQVFKDRSFVGHGGAGDVDELDVVAEAVAEVARL